MMLVAVQVLIALLYVGVEPVRRGFFCDDETIRYPFRSDTVSFTMLLTAFFVVVPLTVSVHQRHLHSLISSIVLVERRCQQCLVMTSVSAIAEGPRDVLVSRNSATTKYRYRVALFA